MNPERRPRVALDAMGGDRAPESVVQGAIDAAAHFHDDLEVVLVGDENAIGCYLPATEAQRLGIEIVHTSESIGMGESATTSYRKKRDSSIAVGIKLLGERRVDAFVSAGNTGAVVTASLLGLGRIKGVHRPAILTIVPTHHGQCLMLDVGANSDTKPAHLYQFAIMGRVYAQSVSGIPEPTIGLLNIGEESSKGSDLAQAAFKMLTECPGNLNFVGNVEGRDILKGTVDVVVCDGFTGNVILKFAESVVGMVVGAIRSELKRSLKFKLGALLLKPVFARVRSRLNYEEYGGAPLLGVDGVVVICHGSSSAKAIRNALRVAASGAREGIDAKIAEELSRELLREEVAG
ncbi:MAG: phosphate acyltransferase PlsX [Candidatus Eisenbacteria bacterium]